MYKCNVIIGIDIASLSPVGQLQFQVCYCVVVVVHTACSLSHSSLDLGTSSSATSRSLSRGQSQSSNGGGGGELSSAASQLILDYMHKVPHTIITPCLKKNIPDIFDCNLKSNCQILIIFGTNIPDTTCCQTTVQFPTSLNVCFCTT